MRRVWMIVLILAVFLLGVTGVQAGPGKGNGRVILRAEDAGALGLAVRQKLGKEVSVPATPATLTALEKRGVSYRHAEEITLDPMAKPKKQNKNASLGPVPYGVKMIYGDRDLTSTSGGAGVTVAILDTGIFMEHRDFTRADGSHVVVACSDFSRDDQEEVTGSCADGHGHGTHVAGTVAAAGGADGWGLWGVAPEASLMVYKVLTDQGAGYSDDIARAIRAAADRGAQIISMSLGTSVNVEEIAEAVRYAVAKGALVIAAAGNSGPGKNTMAYPAALPEVVAVAALDSKEAVAKFSSRGWTDGNDRQISEREMELAAPGEEVLSAFLESGYAIGSGTSMAAPHVAGLAAKRWAEKRAETATDVRAWLVAQATKHDILQGAMASKGYDIASGYGLPQWKVTPRLHW